VNVDGDVDWLGEQPDLLRQAMLGLEGPIELLADSWSIERAEVIPEGFRERTPVVAPEAGHVVAVDAPGLRPAVGEFVADRAVGEQIEQLGLVVLNVMLQVQVDV